MDSAEFDTDEFIGTHLVAPAVVLSDGLVGRFDTLRAALEHLQSRGVAGTRLIVPSWNEELIGGAKLVTLVDAFYAWSTTAGVPTPTRNENGG